ncbi:LOW QUALITY PROTEIN: ankyrin repeat domain-containing protein 34B [Puntigrus tetrazona]|uniref:LOW QUALITY PROTEIN: ankyrin repeat domain-containing protein 34B n=1 Tax=Puntigrus tetrazona TaxID=1606681 RepID=UPI001C8B07EF|nr:LOW QUALITY PROTEIN: ankyrin repeat domain-containing protein 34B [Puntigrus tetrazona]
MTDSPDYLLDGSPLISAAQLGKLRLVRLLVEGGAQVNERNQRGETPLLAACRALRGDQSGSSALRVIRYLLQNQADPNLQDKAGRTALMYACMERAGPDVASALTAAGADPSTEDCGGASALVYAVNARDQDTLAVLMDACRARGRDIIIIATDLSCEPSAAPSPDSSPVSCMSPSDIELKTSSPNSEGENIFNFRGGGRASPELPREAHRRQRLRSEPWLAIQNLAHLSQNYEKNTEEEEDREDGGSPPSGLKCKSSSEQLQSRRNTLPDLLQTPALKLTLSGSDTHLHRAPGSSRFPSVPRSGSPLLAPPDGLHQLHAASRAKPRSPGGFLPPLPGVSARIPAPAPLRREARRHSVQLEQITPKERSETLCMLGSVFQ